MSKYRYFLLIIAVALLSVMLLGCRQNTQARKRLVIWGIGGGEGAKGFEAAMAHYQKMHPELEIVTLRIGAGGTGGEEGQKLLTSIAGHVPPDVVAQDGYNVIDLAARDAFIPLDELIARDRDKPYGVRLEEYYPEGIKEVTYKKKIYAIPYVDDIITMYYNKKSFREAGLDPERPPRTWDELREYARILTKKNAKGQYERMGYIPFQGNAGLVLFAYANAGEFFSSDMRTSTMTDPRIVEAVDYITSFYKDYGGLEKMTEFTSSFRTEAQDPFLMEKVAITTATLWQLTKVMRYHPEMEIGMAPFPVPRDRYERKPPFDKMPKWSSWSSVETYAIPKGAKNVNEAWEWIKWTVSEESVRIQREAQLEYQRSKGKPFVAKVTPNRKVNQMLAREFAPKNENFREGFLLNIDMLEYSKARPPTPVGTRWAYESNMAANDAIYGIKSPRAALAAHQRILQREIDRYYQLKSLKPLNWTYPMIFFGILVVALVIFLVKKVRQFGPLGKLGQGEAKAGILLSLPWTIHLVVLIAGPILVSIVFSFCDYDVLHPAKWVGLLNYKFLLGEDWKILSKSLMNVAFLAGLQIPIGLAVSLGVAMLLNTKIMGMTWYRTIYYLPSIVPSVANAILWAWVMNPGYGLINTAWKATLTNWFNIAAPLWLAGEHTAKPALIVMGLWGAGGGMILWLAGLQGVPQHLYEAADIDGATWWHRFRHVTLPMLSPYIFFNLIMGVIGIMQAFEGFYLMTGAAGGPVNNATLVPGVYLFNNAFGYFKMGYASAIAWLMFVIILALTVLQLKIAPRWVHYEGGRG